MAATGSSERALEAMRFFEELQSRLCARMEALEAKDSTARFQSTLWSKPEDHRLKGGGHMRLMRGAVLEKVGVNLSHVWGTLSDAGM